MEFDNKKLGVRLGVRVCFNVPVRLINENCITRVLPIALEFGQLKKKKFINGQFLEAIRFTVLSKEHCQIVE